MTERKYRTAWQDYTYLFQYEIRYPLSFYGIYWPQSAPLNLVAHISLCLGIIRLFQ